MLLLVPALFAVAIALKLWTPVVVYRLFGRYTDVLFGHSLDDMQHLPLPLLKFTIGFTTVVDKSSLVTTREGIYIQGPAVETIWQRFQVYVIARRLLASAGQVLFQLFLGLDVSRVRVNFLAFGDIIGNKQAQTYLSARSMHVAVCHDRLGQRLRRPNTTHIRAGLTNQAGRHRAFVMSFSILAARTTVMHAPAYRFIARCRLDCARIFVGGDQLEPVKRFGHLCVFLLGHRGEFGQNCNLARLVTWKWAVVTSCLFFLFFHFR